MPQLFDYLEWRGDLTLSEAPLCEVDSLLFSLLSYVELDGIVPAGVAGGVTVRGAAAEYFFTHPTTGSRPLGYILPADILTLLRSMGRARRYRDLLLTGYVKETSEEKQTQFAAVTVRLPEDALFVAFRGTDDSIVGWKEDFNLSFLEEIPAQRRATEYLNGLDLTPETALYVGGHSKGGNLAVWGAIHARAEVRRRIRRVYSHDGPGFSAGTVSSEAYGELAERISALIPEDSLVGLLLEHDESYTVVKSNRKGLFQHDGLSWEVLGGSFIRAEGLSPAGIRHDTAVRARIEAMTLPERQELIRLLFSMLDSTGAKTLTELRSGGVKTALTLLRSFRELTEEERENAAYLWDKLVGRRGDGNALPRPAASPGKEAGRKKGKGRIGVSFFPLLLP